MAALFKSKSHGALPVLQESKKLSYPTDSSGYEILDDCGSGVSSVVSRARVRPTGEVVGIKRCQLDNLGANLTDVLMEASTMRQFQHPNILPLLCSFVVGPELWMVMPFCEGGSVAHIMKYKYPTGLDETVIATIAKEVLKALEYVHKQGRIHRDVKAGNILMDKDGSVRLGDFGVTASMERAASWGHNMVGRLTFVGTPQWMAPEVLEQEQAYNWAADIWSLGITILEMAHGHAPFANMPPLKVLLMTLQGPPPTLEDKEGSKQFSKHMREVVALCCQKDPTRRPPASKLIQHKWFRQAKDRAWLARTLMADLPPLEVRVQAIRQGKAATASKENQKAVARSLSHYLEGVIDWDFNLSNQEMKKATSNLAPIPEGPPISAPQLETPSATPSPAASPPTTPSAAAQSRQSSMPAPSALATPSALAAPSLQSPLLSQEGLAQPPAMSSKHSDSGSEADMIVMYTTRHTHPSPAGSRSSSPAAMRVTSPTPAGQTAASPLPAALEHLAAQQAQILSPSLTAPSPGLPRMTPIATPTGSALTTPEVSPSAAYMLPAPLYSTAQRWDGTVPSPLPSPAHPSVRPAHSPFASQLPSPASSVTSSPMLLSPVGSSDLRRGDQGSLGKPPLPPGARSTPSPSLSRQSSAGAMVGPEVLAQRLAAITATANQAAATAATAAGAAQSVAAAAVGRPTVSPPPGPDALVRKPSLRSSASDTDLASPTLVASRRGRFRVHEEFLPSKTADPGPRAPATASVSKAGSGEVSPSSASAAMGTAVAPAAITAALAPLAATAATQAATAAANAIQAAATAAAVSMPAYAGAATTAPPAMLPGIMHTAAATTGQPAPLSSVPYAFAYPPSSQLTQSGSGPMPTPFMAGMPPSPDGKPSAQQTAMPQFSPLSPASVMSPTDSLASPAGSQTLASSTSAVPAAQLPAASYPPASMPPPTTPAVPQAQGPRSTTSTPSSTGPASTAGTGSTTTTPSPTGVTLTSNAYDTAAVPAIPFPSLQQALSGGMPLPAMSRVGSASKIQAYPEPSVVTQAAVHPASSPQLPAINAAALTKPARAPSPPLSANLPAGQGPAIKVPFYKQWLGLFFHEPKQHAEDVHGLKAERREEAVAADVYARDHMGTYVQAVADQVQSAEQVKAKAADYRYPAEQDSSATDQTPSAVERRDALVPQYPAHHGVQGVSEILPPPMVLKSGFSGGSRWPVEGDHPGLQDSIRFASALGAPLSSAENLLVQRPIVPDTPPVTQGTELPASVATIPKRPPSPHVHFLGPHVQDTVPAVLEATAAGPPARLGCQPKRTSKGRFVITEG